MRDGDRITPTRRDLMAAARTLSSIVAILAERSAHRALAAQAHAAVEGAQAALADPDTIAEDERARRGIHRLPTSLGEALDALEHDDVLATPWTKPWPASTSS
jgi:hypothetical protein